MYLAYVVRRGRILALTYHCIVLVVPVVSVGGPFDFGWVVLLSRRLVPFPQKMVVVNVPLVHYCPMKNAGAVLIENTGHRFLYCCIMISVAVICEDRGFHS